MKLGAGEGEVRAGEGVVGGSEKVKKNEKEKSYIRRREGIKRIVGGSGEGGSGVGE